MKVSWQGFISSIISWGTVAQNICRCLVADGHSVHLRSTNGYDHLFNDLRPCIKTQLDSEYDLQLSYTFPKNFPLYLDKKAKYKFGIWAYEFENYFPDGTAKFHKYCDKLLVPSNHTFQAFQAGGIPSDKMVVIPHGISDEFIHGTSVYPLPTKLQDKIKILLNVQQPHLRKNITGALEAFGKAFTKKDNVVLVVKVLAKKPDKPFEVDINVLLKQFYTTFKDHAEIYLITSYIDDISSLYRACDIYFFPTLAEAFSMTALEALASKMIVITSKHGGQLDFCTPDNSLLIDGKMIYADPRMLYWSNNDLKSQRAKVFSPNTDCSVELLRKAYNELTTLRDKFSWVADDVKQKFTWTKITKQILELAK